MRLPVLLVDGYNIIGSWEELKVMKETDMGSAREQLIATLAAYVSWCWERIIIVFDGQSYLWDNVDGVEVVYTGSPETADTMIERLAAGLAEGYRVEVATSDAAEYRAAAAVGARVYSAAALKEHLKEQQESYRRLTGTKTREGLMLNDLLNEAVLENLKKLRRSY